MATLLLDVDSGVAAVLTIPPALIGGLLVTRDAALVARFLHGWRLTLVGLNVGLRLVVGAKPVSWPYALSVMATNTGSGYRKGAVTGRTQVKNPKTGLWTTRDTTTGQFTTVKKTGGTFKGITREK